MLGRLALIALQIVIGWLGTPVIERYISIGGNAQLFIKAAIAAVIVWLVGLVGAQVLKDIAQPSPAKLSWAMIAGLIAAALIVFQVAQRLGFALPAPQLAIILGFAIVGYHLKR
jgi:hypothetical protein